VRDVLTLDKLINLHGRASLGRGCGLEEGGA